MTRVYQRLLSNAVLIIIIPSAAVSYLKDSARRRCGILSLLSYTIVYARSSDSWRSRYRMSTSAALKGYQDCPNEAICCERGFRTDQMLRRSSAAAEERLVISRYILLPLNCHILEPFHFRTSSKEPARRLMGSWTNSPIYGDCWMDAIGFTTNRPLVLEFQIRPSLVSDP